MTGNMTQTNNEREAVAVLNSTWGSDTGWQYNLKLLPSFETDKYLKSIDGHDIYLYLSPPKQAIPEGWKLVPIEPTHGMLEAVKLERGDYESLAEWSAHGYAEDVIADYKAMLNAAPTNTEVGE